MTILSDELRQIIQAYANECQTLINLNASENYTSPLVKGIIGNHPSYDFYSFPPIGGTISGPWQFDHLCYFSQISEHLNKLGKTLLTCKRIEARLKGGQAAEIAILLALAQKGDFVFCIADQDGGHFGLNHIAKAVGINLCPINFDNYTHYIDLKNTIQNMRRYWTSFNNKLVMLNQSFMLRQLNLVEFVMQVKQEFPQSILCCDISHPFGLIIGKQYTNPLDVGFDLIHGSTHKTMPGPQKGIIGYAEHLAETTINSINKTVSPGLQSNCGTSEVLALAVSLEEMMQHGFNYASTVCQHAKLLASTLYNYGFNVVGANFDFTETHQIWIIIGNEDQAWQASSLLLQAGIRTYPAFLPFTKQWGLRLGTNAITRLGMGKDEIIKIAGFIKDILINKQMTLKLKNSILDLIRRYPTEKVKFTL